MPAHRTTTGHTLVPAATYLLALETSCDDTSVAVMTLPQESELGLPSTGHLQVLAMRSAAQLEHAAWGGVVPELASRAHQRAVLPLITHTLAEAGIGWEEVGLLVYTRGPGLLGSLLVGQSIMKGLALSLSVPLVGANHIDGHALSPLLEGEAAPGFPYLCLVVSGGHTQLMRVDGPTRMTTLGRTQDDAAGEAFDKCAKLLGIDYPGGPVLDRLAAEGDPGAFAFPMARAVGLDFSFSGLKTAFAQTVARLGPDQALARRHDLAASLQGVIVRVLLDRLEQAAADTGLVQVALGGGVAANSGLRAGLAERAARLGWRTTVPRLAYCADNAAMIGLTGYYQYLEQGPSPLSEQPLTRYA